MGRGKRRSYSVDIQYCRFQILLRVALMLSSYHENKIKWSKTRTTEGNFRSVGYVYSLTVRLFNSYFRLPRWLSGKESTYQCRRHRRHGFNPWVRTIPWRRKWQPTPVFLPGKCYGQRSLAGWVVHGVTNSQTWLSDWVHIYLITVNLFTFFSHDGDLNFNFAKGIIFLKIYLVLN